VIKQELLASVAPAEPVTADNTSPTPPKNKPAPRSREKKRPRSAQRHQQHQDCRHRHHDGDACGDADDGEPDSLVADSVARRELGDITKMTLWRWDHDPDMAALGWPCRIQVGNRNFRSRRALERFKRILIAKAVAERSRMLAPKQQQTEAERG
jgi:hypothetical protein